MSQCFNIFIAPLMWTVDDTVVEEVQLHCLIILICIIIAVTLLLLQQNIRLAVWCPQYSVKIFIFAENECKNVSLHLKRC